MIVVILAVKKQPITAKYAAIAELIHCKPDTNTTLSILDCHFFNCTTRVKYMNLQIISQQSLHFCKHNKMLSDNTLRAYQKNHNALPTSPAKTYQ